MICTRKEKKSVLDACDYLHRETFCQCDYFFKIVAFFNIENIALNFQNFQYFYLKKDKNNHFKQYNCADNLIIDKIFMIRN
jgi:hypothetical protein